MPKARKEQISLSDTPYYHCISRCVRRAFLCGSDPFSGKDYQHRKQWMVERLTHLAQVFAIEIFAYSLMYKAFVNSTQKNGSEVSTYAGSCLVRLSPVLLKSLIIFYLP